MPIDQVDHGNHDQVGEGALGAGAEELAVTVQEDGFSAQQAKNGCGCAQRRRSGEKEGRHVAGEAAHHVKRQVASMTVIALELRTKRQQGVHVQGNVQDAPVQEHGRKQAPELTLDDQLVGFYPQGCRVIEAEHALGEPLQRKDDDAQAEQGVGNQRRALGCFYHHRLRGRRGRRVLRGITLAHKVTFLGWTRWCSAAMMARMISTVRSSCPLRLVTA